jgi:hypothetical protein
MKGAVVSEAPSCQRARGRAQGLGQRDLAARGFAFYLQLGEPLWKISRA